MLDEIRALPKVEIHVHLESSVEAETIAELAASLGEPMPRPVDRLYTYTGLDDLLRTCEWWCAICSGRPRSPSGSPTATPRGWPATASSTPR